MGRGGRWQLPSIQEAAAAEHEQIRAKRDAEIQARGLPDLASYVTELSPQLMAPRHLAPMIRHVEAYETEPFKMVFSVPPRHGKPLAGDTLVRMADGSLRPIRELRRGHRVVSGTGRPTTVTGMYAQGVLPVWRVRTAGGQEFLAEGSHRFLTARRGWRRVDELRVGGRAADSLVGCERYELDAPGRVVGASLGFLPWGSRLCAGRWVPDRVVAVEPAGVRECFCITVAEDESFLVTAGNLVTHNTETLLHLVPWILRKNPWMRVGYVTYSLGLARRQALKVMRLCQAAGVRFATKKVMDWETPEGGGFVATGIGGTMTGLGFNILIVDDAIKDRATAESRVYRDKIYDWFTSTARTRLMPKASVIVCGTRWHVDDLSGRLSKGDPGEGRKPYLTVNMPAIADDPVEAAALGREVGSALWPEFWAKEVMLETMTEVGPYNWASLYQGRPVPRGGQVFKDPFFWDKLPTAGYRVNIGVDLAGTANTKRDHSVVVVGWYVPDEDKIYVVRVIRAQMEAAAFKKHVRETIPEYIRPNAAKWRYYGYGMEVAAASFYRAEPDPIPVEIVQAPGDKFVRAQPYAGAWNAGRVLLPSPKFREEAEDVGQDHLWQWADVYVSEHVNFTGQKHGETDDQVDAGAAMHDAARPLDFSPKGPPVSRFTWGGRR